MTRTFELIHYVVLFLWFGMWIYVFSFLGVGFEMSTRKNISGIYRVSLFAFCLI